MRRAEPVGTGIILNFACVASAGVYRSTGIGTEFTMRLRYQRVRVGRVVQEDAPVHGPRDRPPARHAASIFKAGAIRVTEARAQYNTSVCCSRATVKHRLKQAGWRSR